jgi:hypothetical protein
MAVVVYTIVIVIVYMPQSLSTTRERSLEQYVAMALGIGGYSFNGAYDETLASVYAAWVALDECPEKSVCHTAF